MQTELQRTYIIATLARIYIACAVLCVIAMERQTQPRGEHGTRSRKQEYVQEDNISFYGR